MAWPFSIEPRQAPERRHIPLTSGVEEQAPVPGVDIKSALFPLGASSFMARTSEVYAKEGYAENVVVNACIHKIAAAGSSIGLQLQKGEDGDLVDVHPILDLLRRPNPMNSGSDFIYAVLAWRQIAGEAFVVRQPWGTGKPGGGKPTQLWLLEPHRVKVNHGLFGMPESYEYATGGKTLTFPVDLATGRCDVLHLRQFNPLNNTRGLSPMSAAAYSIDTHNSAMRWNKALLDNAARPSGALVMKSKDGAAMPLADEQFTRLKSQIDEDMTGAANARRPLLLEGGLEWQEMGLTPSEMDFNSGIWMAATHICAAFQVPPQMLGIPGTSTFANFEQATLTFWEDVVVALLESTLDGLNHWLVPMYGDTSLYLEADKDTISALEPRRQIKYDRAEKAGFITVNEKREMAGYDHVDAKAGGDAILVPSTNVPLDLIAADVALDPQPAPAPQDEPTTLPDQSAPKPPAGDVKP